MNNLIRNCIYQGKNMYRDKGLFFWSLIYPIILAIFFQIAFGGLIDVKLEEIYVGIKRDNPIRFILKEIEFLNIKEIIDSEIEEKLDNEDIHGFIDNDLNILVKESGINQTVIKEIVEQIRQMENLNKPIKSYDFSVDYVSSESQKANSIIVTFYALIAMVSTYGIFAGIETVDIIQANLSNVGARINVAPLKKHNFLIAGIIVSLILNLLANGLLILFTKYVLKLNLFSEIKYSFIFIILGNIFGVSLGMLIGVSSNKSNNAKTIIGISITLVLSALSGMMGSWIKLMIDEYVPILNRINPISIITNNLYRINLLESTKNIRGSILILATYCVILVSASYILLRGHNYDSV